MKWNYFFCISLNIAISKKSVMCKQDKYLQFTKQETLIKKAFTTFLITIIIWYFEMSKNLIGEMKLKIKELSQKV